MPNTNLNLNTIEAEAVNIGTPIAVQSAPISNLMMKIFHDSWPSWHIQEQNDTWRRHSGVSGCHALCSLPVPELTSDGCSVIVASAVVQVGESWAVIILIQRCHGLMLVISVQTTLLQITSFRSSSSNIEEIERLKRAISSNTER